MFSLIVHTVEPPLSDHPKWSLIKEVVAYKIIEPQGASTEKRSGHIYFMEDDLLHAISN